MSKEIENIDIELLDGADENYLATKYQFIRSEMSIRKIEIDGMNRNIKRYSKEIMLLHKELVEVMVELEKFGWSFTND